MANDARDVKQPKRAGHRATNLGAGNHCRGGNPNSGYLPNAEAHNDWFANVLASNRERDCGW
jgi:hypothetical protein